MTAILPPWLRTDRKSCSWAEDINSEKHAHYADDPDDAPPALDRAWDWILSKPRFTDPSDSYAWLWEGLDDSDLMLYSSSSCEDALKIQAPYLWDRLLTDYETRTGEPCPLSQDDYAEFLKRSDYADALQAYKDRVQQAKPKLSEK